MVTAGDGRRAFEIARREQPGVILMYIQMAEMDGREAPGELHEDSER